MPVARAAFRLPGSITIWAAYERALLKMTLNPFPNLSCLRFMECRLYKIGFPPVTATVAPDRLGGKCDQVATVTGVLDVAVHQETASTGTFNEPLGLLRVFMLVVIAHQDIGPLASKARSTSVALLTIIGAGPSGRSFPAWIAAAQERVVSEIGCSSGCSSIGRLRPEGRLAGLLTSLVNAPARRRGAL
jgi:hypothetical protein